MRRRSRWSATARRTTPSWPASATQSTETEPHVDVVTTGPERAMLENMVALNRESLIDSVEKLTEAEARQRLVPSLTTPLGLVNHAAPADPTCFHRRVPALPGTEGAAPAHGDDRGFPHPDKDT